MSTSAGIGGFLDRTGLAGTGLVFTTAAGVHATPTVLVASTVARAEPEAIAAAVARASGQP